MGAGMERSPGTRIVTYADDLVSLCRRGKAEEALQRLREITSKLKLKVNEENESARPRKGRSPFWGIRWGGGIRREPARHAWDSFHAATSRLLITRPRHYFKSIHITLKVYTLP